MCKILWPLLVCAVTGCAFPAATAGAGEEDKKLSLDKTPQAVQAAIKDRFPGAEVTGIEKDTDDGKDMYTVELKHKGRKYEMDIQEDGTVDEVEKAIAVKDLPAAVTRALEARYPRATLREAMEVYDVVGKDETLSEYAVSLETAGKKVMDVRVSLDGKTIKEEDDDP